VNKTTLKALNEQTLRQFKETKLIFLRTLLGWKGKEKDSKNLHSLDEMIRDVKNIQAE